MLKSSFKRLILKLDIDLKCGLEHGTAQTTSLRKTDVIIIDEFSMIDATLFLTIEGLCRRYAKKVVLSILGEVDTSFYLVILLSCQLCPTRTYLALTYG